MSLVNRRIKSEFAAAGPANNKVLIAVAVGSALLVGCGGGGGSGESSAPPVKPSVSVSASSLSLDEGSKSELTLKYKAGSTVSVAVSNQAVKASIEGDSLVLSASETDRPVTAEVSVTSFINGDEATSKVAVYVRNASAEALARKAGLLVEDESNVKRLSQDRQLYEFFVDFAYLGGAISSAEKTMHLDQFDADGEASYFTLERQFSALSTAEREYQRGNIADTELQSVLTQTEALIREHAAYGKGRLASVSEFSDVVVPGFVPADLEYDSRSGLYSRFLSNTEFGDYVDGQYQFKAAYAAMSSLIRVTANDTAMCGVI